MRRALPMLVTATLVAGACSGSDDAADTTVPVPDTVAETTTTEAPPATEALTTVVETTTTEAPTTTVDEAALLADAEAAYLEAFEVGKEVLRNPDNPDNEQRISELYIGPNLDGVLEDLRRTVDGDFVAFVNDDNPSFATVVEPAEFVDDNPTEARLTVCEFNSDRIYEVGTAPDGSNSLVRDDPVSILITVRMQLVEGQWKTSSGTRGEEIRDEIERCSST